MMNSLQDENKYHAMMAAAALAGLYITQSLCNPKEKEECIERAIEVMRSMASGRKAA